MTRAIAEVLKELGAVPPQTKVEIMRGFHIRMKRGMGVAVCTLHRRANPARDEDTPEGAIWFKTERSRYSSQGAWDREQEIQDLAGGGELVFADTLITYWNKIVISDPKWRPDPRWDVYGGFDHGKTNPSTLGKMYVDFLGNKYLCGEYYMPGREIAQHVRGTDVDGVHHPGLAEMEDIRKIQQCWADPSIFPEIHQQSQQGQAEQKKAKSTNDLYIEEGIELFTKYVGDRSDWSSAQRVLAHWKELPQGGEPQLFIVCRFPDADSPRPGLHHWDSPNLLWEMMRARKKKLTAQQLMAKNPSEEIIDKDNHARDAMLKYCLMNLPEPTARSKEEIMKERLAAIPKEDVTSRVIRGNDLRKELEEDEGDEGPVVSLGRRRR